MECILYGEQETHHAQAERAIPGGGRLVSRGPSSRKALGAVTLLLLALGAMAVWKILVPPGPEGSRVDPPPPGAARGTAPGPAATAHAGRDASLPPAPAAAEPREVPLVDVTREAGISFHHEAGARGKLYNPETFGTGCGWFDHDGDGHIDILYVNSNLLEGDLDPTATSILYRNLGDGTFRDVTEEAGIKVPFYGMGFVSGDVDDDGDQDLLLYGLHRSCFFLNVGGGKFEDATKRAGLENLPGWICSATFLDYDRDGALDLFVGNYVRWSPQSEEGVDCTFGTPSKKYCPVAVFDPSSPQLFRGRGDGTFEETTEAAGFSRLKGKSLGVAVEDYDRNGFPDLFVANDAIPNFLLHNAGDGTFVDRGIESGFATDADGAALAGMGIDTAWVPDDGPLCTAIGNFSGEPTTFHVQEEGDYFVERSISWGLGRDTLDRVTFGLLLVDADLNGALDLFLINGHVFDVEDITGVPYAQKPQLFLARNWKTFREMAPADPGHFLNRRIIGRSIAAADYDQDGDLDFAVTINQGPGLLLRNDLPDPKRHVRVDLRGTTSNRDALGAEVTIHLAGAAGARSVRRTRKATSSYLSQSERTITFGIPPGYDDIQVEVLWPSGLNEHFEKIPLGRESLLVEGTGSREPSPQVASARAAIAASPRRERPSGLAGSAGPNPVVLRRRGAELYRMAKFSEALAVFEQAADVVPHDFVVQRFILMALFRLGREAEVDAKVVEITEIFPDATLLVSHFALVLRETGYGALAERIFRESSRLDPRRVDVWISLGNSSFDRRELDDAHECYARALKLKPDSVEALANIGKVHTLRKSFDEAIPFLERALELRPDYATALSTLGGIMIELGDYTKAQVELERALTYPGSPETRMTIHGNLGILYYKLRDFERAREHFEKVLETGPEDPQARAILERLQRR